MKNKVQSCYFRKNALREFIAKYVSAYRSLVEKSYLDQKELFSLYNNYPYHVIAYLAPRQTLFEYQPKVRRFAVRVKLVSELPKLDIRTKHYIGAYRNDYLSTIIKKPEEAAKEDVLHEIGGYEAYEKSQEELAEYYEGQEAKYVDEFVTYVMDNYSSYIETAYKAKEETISKEKSEIYDIVTIINHVRGYLTEALTHSYCSASFSVLDEITQDIDSSLFLAMHGKYVPANSLLRRIMEMALTALYLDDEIRKHPKGSRTYRVLCQKREAWVMKPSGRHSSFTSEFGIMGLLIDPDTDYYAKKILNVNKIISEKPFRNYLRDLYSELCKFVHYGGLGLTDRFPLQFAEFDEKKFKEWLLRFRRIFEAYVILLAVKFPEVLRVYEELETNLNDFERVSLLTSEQQSVLKALRISGA